MIGIHQPPMFPMLVLRQRLTVEVCGLNHSVRAVAVFESGPLIQHTHCPYMRVVHVEDDKLDECKMRFDAAVDMMFLALNNVCSDPNLFHPSFIPTPSMKALAYAVWP